MCYFTSAILSPHHCNPVFVSDSLEKWMKGVNMAWEKNGDMVVHKNMDKNMHQVQEDMKNVRLSLNASWDKGSCEKVNV